MCVRGRVFVWMPKQKFATTAFSGLKFWHQSYTSIIYFSCYKFENKDSKIVVTGYTDAVKSFDDKSLTFWFSLLFSFTWIQLVKNETTSFPCCRIFDSYLRSWIFCENEALYRALWSEVLRLRSQAITGHTAPQPKP